MIRKEYGVFDWRDYLGNHKDLKHIKSNIQALKHFTEIVENEKMKAIKIIIALMLFFCLF